MPSIIQDFAKIINSRISKTLLVYLGLIFCLTSGFMIGRATKILDNIPEVTIGNLDGSEYDYNIENATSGAQEYQDEYKNASNAATLDKSQIFASSKGKYFYYKGCGGSSIAQKNLVYYKSEQAALAAGKILYNKCK